MRFRWGTVAATGVLVGSMTGGAAFVLAAQPEPVERRAPQVVKVCVTKKSVVVSANKRGKCPRGTRLTAISKTGPRGPVGPVGPTGAPGSPGSPGSPGATVTVSPTAPTATVTVTEVPSDDGTLDGGTP